MGRLRLAIVLSVGLAVGAQLGAQLGEGSGPCWGNPFETGGPVPVPGPGAGGPTLGGPCGDPWVAKPVEDVAGGTAAPSDEALAGDGSTGEALEGLPHSEQGRRSSDGVAEHGPG